MTTPQRLHIATRTIDAVRDLKFVTTLSGLRSLLELCNVYRRIAPNFSRMAAPLIKHSKIGEPTAFELNDEEQQTIDALKKEPITPPVLALPRLEVQLVIETDACDKHVGSVLLQEQEEGELRSIGY